MIDKAISEIDERLKFSIDYGKHIPEYFDALVIAKKSMESQKRLIEILEEMKNACNESDSFSYGFVMETINELRWDWKVDE